jgi:hypothetical protein
MARKLKPMDETKSDLHDRIMLESIANKAVRGEKVSWNRKMDNMISQLADLAQIEERIFDIIVTEKNPILDQISELRELMVNECIHPIEQLVVKEGGYAECKFCNKRIRLQSQ